MNTINHTIRWTTKHTARQLGFSILVLVLILLTLRSAFALTITQTNTPATIHEGETLRVNFTTDTPATDLILRNGEIASTTNTYETLLNYDAAGLDNYTFQATAGNATATTSRTVEILDTPLTITLLEPSTTDYATPTIPISLTTNIPGDLCYVVAPGGTNTLTKQNETAFNGTITLADGIYTLALKCTRNTEVTQTNVTLRVDTTPPTTTLTPTGTVTDSPVLLTATTDEIANCRYDTQPNPYDEMTAHFPQDASLTHVANLSLAEGTNTYYATCQDALGNTGQPTGTTFTLLQPPTAAITVEGKNPHKAGSYQLTLTVSRPLQQVPTLTLTYQGGTSATLALTQLSPLTYEGDVIVADDAGEQVGSFQFSGTDTRGVTGTRITDGDLFVVDTVKPLQVQAFKAVNGSGYVNLTWFDDQPNVVYNIYRSTEPGVSYTDLLTSVSGQSYEDYDVKEAVTYYYRLAADDDAGNVGDLSNEEYASPAAATYQEQAAGALLDPVLQVGLDTRLNALETKLLDIQRALGDLQAETDKERSALIASLDLINKTDAGRQTLTTAKGKLEALRTLSLTRDEFNARITAIQDDVDAALAATPTAVAVANKADYDEANGPDAITAAASHALGGQTLSATDRATYEDHATSLQQNIKVSVAIIQGNVTYADGLIQPYTVVEKRLLATDQQSDVIAIETIPKSFAQHAADIIFLGQQPVILEQDPVVQYSFDTLTDTTVQYAVKGTIDLPVARGSSMILLPKPSAATTASATTGNENTTSPDGNGLTGNVLASITTLASGQGALIALGVLIIAALLFYYFKIQNEASETQPMILSTQPSQPSFPITPTNTASPSAAPQGLGAITQTIVVERREEPLAGLLLRGHTLIDENKYLDALHFYRQALARFAEEPFPSLNVKEAVRQELELLHTKLMLFDTLSKAHETAYAGDNRRLAEQIERLHTLAASVGNTGTPLVEKAKLQYGYLYGRLNQLRVENGDLEQLL